VILLVASTMAAVNATPTLWAREPTCFRGNIGDPCNGHATGCSLNNSQVSSFLLLLRGTREGMMILLPSLLVAFLLQLDRGHGVG